MLAQQLQTQFTREDTGAVAEPGRVPGLTFLALVVEHRTRQFTVVRPRPAVEVVAADAGPHIVDHTHLGMNVNRCAFVVFHVEHVHTVRCGPTARGDGLLPTHLVGR